MSVSCIAEYSTVVKDVVLTLAAVVGAYVALQGLTTWNRQLKGGVEYELTRRLLKQTYRLREAIKGVRHPVMWSGEAPPLSAEQAKSMSQEQLRFFELSNAYQKRWDRVTDVRTELQTELLEAEVLWGQEIHKQFEPLFKLQHELFIAVHFYITVCDPDVPQHTREAREKAIRNNRDILYDLSGETEDEFTSDVNRAIASIEAFLKPHLRK
jgi:hypothetical protein